MPISLTESIWIILSFVSGSLIIGLVMILLYHYQKIPYLRSWALYWFMLFAAYLNLYMYAQSEQVFLLATYYYIIIISGMVFMHASHRFLSIKVPMWLLITDIIIFVSTIAISSSSVSVIVKLYAVFGVFGWYLLASGVFFIWKEGKKAMVTAILIMVLGLINIAYPFTFTNVYIQQFGYTVTSIVGTGVGIGILGMHFMRLYHSEEQLKEHLRYLSYHDDLTPLLNRTYMTEKLSEMDNDNQLPIALILSDLNELKLINDHYGHRAGDDLIRATADILLKHTFRKDMVVRYGGDEFVTIMLQTSEEAVSTYLQSVKNDCQSTLIQERPISLAMGYALKNDSSISLDSLFDQAEIVMYQEKKIHRQSETRQDSSL